MFDEPLLRATPCSKENGKVPSSSREESKTIRAPGQVFQRNCNAESRSAPSQESALTLSDREDLRKTDILFEWVYRHVIGTITA